MSGKKICKMSQMGEKLNQHELEETQLKHGSIHHLLAT